MSNVVYPLVDLGFAYPRADHLSKIALSNASRYSPSFYWCGVGPADYYYLCKDFILLGVVRVTFAKVVENLVAFVPHRTGDCLINVLATKECFHTCLVYLVCVISYIPT